MIKNYKGLTQDIPTEFKKRREILLNIADYVLKNISPDKFFPARLKRHFSKNSLATYKRIAVFGIGKAARSMADALIPLLGRKPDFVLFADSGHPLPTRKGLENTRKIISTARALGKEDLAIVLLSGGGSAMLVSPVNEISLQNKIAVTGSLLKCGATIQEMNVVRKHLSEVKGGRLAALLYPAKTLCFVMSDVVGNDLGTISSGPLSPDTSTFKDAIDIIKKYKVHAPKAVLNYLEKGVKDKKLETPKPREKYFKNVSIKIIADHGTVLDLAYKRAKKYGLRIIKISKPLTGEAADTVKSIVLKSKPESILLASGETTVTCRGRGYGGRNQELVLSGLRYIKRGQTLCSIATDGVDGMCPEEIAGAIGDSLTVKSSRKKNLAIGDFLRRNDSYAFFKKTNGLIKTGKTGTNLGDLMMLI